MQSMESITSLCFIYYDIGLYRAAVTVLKSDVHQGWPAIVLTPKRGNLYANIVYYIYAVSGYKSEFVAIS